MQPIQLCVLSLYLLSLTHSSIPSLSLCYWCLLLFCRRSLLARGTVVRRPAGRARHPLPRRTFGPLLLFAPTRVTRRVINLLLLRLRLARLLLPRLNRSLEFLLTHAHEVHVHHIHQVESLLRLFLQHLEDQIFGQGRQRDIFVKLWLARTNLLPQIVLIVRVKRQLSLNQREPNYADSPHV